MIEWRPVVGYEALYSVSNTGEVFSQPKLCAFGKNAVARRGGKTLKQYTANDRTEHLRVYLSDGKGRKRPMYVHRLVAEAFIPNPDELPVLNHKDNNPRNNHVENLEWCTVAQNNAHRLRLGPRKMSDQKGVKNSQAKLTDADVLAIRRRYRECGNASQVAREFGISATYCGNICARRMWKHVASE